VSSHPSSSAKSRPIQLDALLKSRSIAVLGASERPSIGRSLMVSAEILGFEGRIYPVNPKYESILGRRCYPSVSELPEAPDVVAFCVGYTRVLENVKLAAARGARGAAIYDGGFAERGEEGIRLQAEIGDICRSASVALCGPNCMGVLNPRDRSSVYIEELRDTTGLAGNVGIISQSGSICIGLLTDVRRFGFSHMISSGNEAVLAAVDYLEALIDEPETKVIGLFLESVRQPDRFVAALDRAAESGKPVVVLKVGRGERTQRAIVSHTGGLAGSSRVFSEVLRAHRAIETGDMDEFTEVLAACQAGRWPIGRRIVVITASGGQSELILDVATQAGLELPALPANHRAEVERVVGPITGDGNPLDVWGNGDFSTNLPHALKVLEANEVCDTIVLVSDQNDNQPTGRAERALDYLKLVAEAADASMKPHFVMNVRPGIMMRSQVDFLYEKGLSYLGGTRQGLGALDRLARWSRPRAPSRPVRRLRGRGVAGPLAAVPGRRTINEADAKALLKAEGLPVTRERLVDELARAREAALEIGYPVVLKAVSDDIAHKSDLGLVILGIRDEAELEAAWTRLGDRIKAAPSHGMVKAVLVQEMVQGGIEVFIGVNRDADFGLMLAFGLGGIAIEILQDTALRVLPLAEGDAAAMISEIRAAALLRGARGAGPYDVDALVACVEAFADYAWADRDNLAEIDLNPIKVLPKGQGCRIVDALIVPRQ
jgi:acetate---CoA ligase (ADP-forming)